MKKENNNNIEQIQCCNANCGSCRIQLISLRKITKTRTELSIICMTCGLLMSVGAGGIQRPVVKNREKQPDYLG